MKPMVPASLLLLCVSAVFAADSSGQDWRQELEKAIAAPPASARTALAPTEPAPAAAPAVALAPGQTTKVETTTAPKAVMTSPTAASSSGASTAGATMSALPAAGTPSLLAAPTEERQKLDKLTILNQIDQQEFARKLRPLNEQRDETTARYNTGAEKARLELQALELEVKKMQMDTSIADERKKKDLAAMRAEIERMQVDASLAEERKKKELALQRAEIERLRLENERASVRLESERLKAEGDNLKITQALRDMGLTIK